jgi:hypothetical protein
MSRKNKEGGLGVQLFLLRKARQNVAVVFIDFVFSLV